jgi:hypothetical protein
MLLRLDLELSFIIGYCLVHYSVFTATKVYALILGLASNRTVVVERGRIKYLEEMEEWCGGKGTLYLRCI